MLCGQINASKARLFYGKTPSAGAARFEPLTGQAETRGAASRPARLPFVRPKKGCPERKLANRPGVIYD